MFVQRFPPNTHGSLRWGWGQGPVPLHIPFPCPYYVGAVSPWIHPPPPRPPQPRPRTSAPSHMTADQHVCAKCPHARNSGCFWQCNVHVPIGSAPVSPGTPIARRDRQRLPGVCRSPPSATSASASTTGLCRAHCRRPEGTGGGAPAEGPRPDGRAGGDQHPSGGGAGR